LNITVHGLLAGGAKTIFHQPLAPKAMIAPRVGDCKGFNKFQQSGIYLA